MKLFRTFACGFLLTGSLIYAEPALVITAINNKTDAPIAISLAGQSVVLAQDTSITKPVALALQPKQSPAVGDPLGSNQAWELKHLLQISQAPAYAAEMKSIRALINELKTKKKEQKALTATLKRMNTQRADTLEDLAELTQEDGSTADEIDNERAGSLALQMRELDRDIKVTERALRDTNQDLAELTEKITKKRSSLAEKQQTGKDFQPLFELSFSTSKQQAYGAAFASGVVTLKTISGQEIVSFKEPNLPLSNFANDYLFELVITLVNDGSQIKPQLSLSKQLKTGSAQLPSYDLTQPSPEEDEPEEELEENVEENEEEE